MALDLSAQCVSRPAQALRLGVGADSGQIDNAHTIEVGAFPIGELRRARRFDVRRHGHVMRRLRGLAPPTFVEAEAGERQLQRSSHVLPHEPPQRWQQHAKDQEHDWAVAVLCE